MTGLLDFCFDAVPKMVLFAYFIFHVSFYMRKISKTKRRVSIHQLFLSLLMSLAQTITSDRPSVNLKMCTPVTLPGQRCFNILLENFISFSLIHSFVYWLIFVSFEAAWKFSTCNTCTFAKMEIFGWCAYLGFTRLVNLDPE